MPRGHKSKGRKRQKQPQARHEAETRRILEAAAVMDEETPSSSSSAVEGDPQSSSVTEASNTSQGTSRATVTTITCSGALLTRSESSQHEEHACPTEVLPAESSGSDPLTTQVSLLEELLLDKCEASQPILEEEMLNAINIKYHDQFAEILRKACERIEVLFAVDLKEVDSSRHSYELVSKLKLPKNGRLRAGTGFPKTGLLMSVLGVIFLSGNRAAEEDVWQFLNRMGVYRGKKHFIYGEPKRRITKDFVRLKYLEYRQVPDSDPPRYEFLWGPKAYVETSKMKVLEHVAKITKKVPSAFSAQYEEALREEEERAHARGAAGAEPSTAGSSETSATDTESPPPSEG